MEGKPTSKRWLTIILVGIVAIILIFAGLFFGLANDGTIAKRSPEEIILPSIDIPGTWEKAPMPLRYMAPLPAAGFFTWGVFWWNDTNGNEAAIYISLNGWISASNAKSVFESWFLNFPSIKMNVSLGDEAIARIDDNYTVHSYQNNVTWDHICFIDMLKMNYVCSVAVGYQDSSGLNPISAMQVAIEQVNRIQ